MKIRLAQKKDIQEITSLNRGYFKERERDWKTLISAKTSEMFVLEIDNEIIGFSGLQFHA